MRKSLLILSIIFAIIGALEGIGGLSGYTGDIVISYVFFTLSVITGIIGKYTGSKPEMRDNITSSNSLEILKERYAKGEISKEEFEQKKNDLES